MTSPNIIITPSLNDIEATNNMFTTITSFLLSYLPPHQQQLISHSQFNDKNLKNEIFSDYVKVLDIDHATNGGSVSISNITFSPFSTLREVELSKLISLYFQSKAASASTFSTSETSSDMIDASEEHSVIQASSPLETVQIMKAMKGNGDGSNNNSLLHVQVKFKDNLYDIHVPSGLSGLQLKSFIIRELSLDGGFQHYYLTLNGTPFGSRVPIASHPILQPIMQRQHPHDNTGDNRVSLPPPVLDLEITGSRPKAVGHT